MHTFLKTSAFLLALGFTANTYAQDTKPAAKAGSDENIVIHKKAGSTEKLTIVVDGDKITVNGKPVDEFKDDNIAITKEKPWPSLSLDYAPATISGDWDISRNGFGRTIKSNKAVLGVMTEKTDEGAKITDVTDESAADKAGLKEGDIITKFGDDKIADADDLYKAVGKYKPDDKVIITYKRDGKEATAPVTLKKNTEIKVFGFNGGQNLSMKVAPRGVYSFYRGRPRMGVQVQDTEDGKGVKVLDVDDETPADKAGLKDDDLITQVNGKNITSVDDLKDAIKDGKDGDTFKVTYVRDGQTKTVDVHYPKDLKTSNL
ncbi:MAG TPA: PDZ domain-containing protein [Chitinophagaceae bacterium]|nr:PDZ domain-containing protein [Chitinophagaceae bacterium]